MLQVLETTLIRSPRISCGTNVLFQSFNLRLLEILFALMKRKWTRSEKLLWASPLLMGVLAFGISQGPNIVRRARGLPRVLTTHDTHMVFSLVISNDGSVLAASGMDEKASNPDSGTVYFWDARTLAPLKPLKGQFWKVSSRDFGGFRTDGLALSPDGKLVGLSDRGQPGYAVYEVESQRKLWQVTRSGFSAEFSPDGSLILLNGGQLYDARTGKLMAGVTDMGYSGFVPGRFAPDGKTVALVGPETKRPPANGKETPKPPNGKSIEIHRVSDGKKLLVLKDSQETNAIDFSPDGTKILSLATGSDNMNGVDGSTVRCHSATGQLLWQHNYRESNPKRTDYGTFADAKFSPDGSLIAVGSNSFSITNPV
ncbi:hypothetical protein EON80_08040, partial [bacterium]